MLKQRTLLLLCFALLWSSGVLAADAHTSNSAISAEVFVAESFAGAHPVAEKLWLDSEQKKQLAAILGHSYPGLRIRYWGAGTRTLWILDEIGKERPITIAVVVDEQKIAEVKVLAFRESRGGEVQYPFFTEQFRGISMDEQQLDKPVLDKSIDGITGATLSVRAVTRVATAALYLHQLTSYAQDQGTKAP